MFERAMGKRHGGNPYEWLFLAMIEHEQGHAAEANRWFDRSVAWMRAHKVPVPDLMRLEAQGAAFLGRPGSDAGETPAATGTPCKP